LEIDQIKRYILDYISKNPTKINIKNLSIELNCDYFLVQSVLKELENSGDISIINGFYFIQKNNINSKKGHLSLTSKGFGFVKVSDEEKYLVPTPFLNGASHGDFVSFKTQKSKNGDGNIAVIEKVLKSKISRIVVLCKKQYRDFDNDKLLYIPDKNIFSKKIVVVNPKKYHINHKLVLDIISNHENKIICKVYKDLGHFKNKYVDIISVAYSYSLEEDFPKEVLDEASKLKVLDEDLKNRQDLTSKTFVTIDGEDAKDLDDAICVEKTNNGYKLFVSIADVSHFIKKNSELDYEALRRGTSVYLIEKVIPMLPKNISNNLCSLNPHEIKLTQTCEITLSDSGEIIKYDVYSSFIKTFGRLTYSEVNNLFSDQSLIIKNTEISNMLLNSISLYKKVKDIKTKKGMVYIDLKESKIILDKFGKTKDVVFKERKESEELIEQFMVLANECVAQYIHKYKEKTIGLYRTHESPNEKKSENLHKLTRFFGAYEEKTKGNVDHKTIQNLVNSQKYSLQKEVISMIILKSMEKAKYNTENIGHFGLASKCYTHFTSPIRRYCDLIIHRILKIIEENSFDKNPFCKNELIMNEIAEQCNCTEVTAVDCEREVYKIKKAEFLLGKIGHIFEGKIITISKIGFFVSLDNGTEGLVHISELKDDEYEYNEEIFSLVGIKSKKKYSLGQIVRIKVEKVIVFQGKVDFKLVE